MRDQSEPTRPVTIPADEIALAGDLCLPENAGGLVIFAHGSGSSRHSPRNRAVAGALNEAGLATLLFDLLTESEEPADRYARHLRFDIPLLTRRLEAAVAWATAHHETAALPIGLFGASTGAAAALVTAANRPQQITAVVSRGGRADLAETALPRVRAPTLLIVGGHDDLVVELNEAAAARMRCEVRVEVVPDATHLFQEYGALEQVARLARDWLVHHLTAARHTEPEN